MNTKITSAVQCVFLLSLLTSCGGNGGGGSNSSSISPAIQPKASSTEGSILSIEVKRQVELNADLSNLDDYKKYINYYNIQVATKDVSEKSRVACYKIIFDRHSNMYNDAFGSKVLNTIGMKLNDQDPTSVDVECAILDENKVYAKESLSLRKSFVISGETRFNDLKISNQDEIATLFLDKNAILKVGSGDIDLQIDEIFSNDAKIVTYSEADAASTPVNTRGKNGASIHIKTRAAKGKLAVELRGTNGGKQTREADAQENLLADTQLNGQCRYISDKNNCEGREGHPGLKGNHGWSGYSGGDSGSLDLSIAENSELKLAIFYTAGVGSSPTLGGKGGKGSPGGIGSKYTWISSGGRDHEQIENFKEYPSGKQGIDGVRGEDGIPGEDGKVQESIFENGSETLKFVNNGNN